MGLSSPSHRLTTVLFAAALIAAVGYPSAQTATIRVPLEYRAPGDGKPAPNFSPKGTQVKLTDVPASAALPAGAVRPARSGVIEIGPGKASWIPVLATAVAAHPMDLCQLFLDRNRNGRFDDDGPPVGATPTQNDKTKAWWTSINGIDLSVPHSPAGVEPYQVNVWIVREDGAPTPDVLRYSVRSWRQGTVTVNGVAAIVAVMDADNDALFTKADLWSAMGAAEPNAAKAVLSIAEARPMNRLMFLQSGQKEVALQFKGISQDGHSIDLAVVNADVTKAADRAPDDLVRDERPRPRTETPVVWGHGASGFEAALTRAKNEHKAVLIDFEATWCGPCHTMDEWIWSDAEVADRIRGGYLGVKVDADQEKAFVKRFNITGYPTMVVVDATGREIARASDYRSSKEMLQFLRR